MEEEPREFVLAQVIEDLSDHYDAIWIAASRDATHPLVIIGVNEDPERLMDRDTLEKFATDWIEFWKNKYGDDLRIDLTEYRTIEILEWDLLMDKRVNIKKPIEWLEFVFFKEDPFDDNEEDYISSGIEEAA